MARAHVPYALLLAACLVAAPIPAAAEGAKKADPEAVAKGIAAFLKKKELGKKDPEEIGKRIAGLSEEDLATILDRLRGTDAKDRGAAAPAVEGIVEDALLSARWSLAVLRLPDAGKRLADASPAALCTLMSDLSRLEDAEPATRFTLRVMEGADLPVRLRAMDTLADLASWGGDAARLLPPLRKGLADPSPAVRDTALERLAGLSDLPALDWSIDHAGDAAEEEVVLREVKTRCCPGDRALEIATRTSRVRYGMEVDAWRELTDAERTEAREEMRRWRAKVGGNPLRNGDEGPFDPIPKVSTVIVDPLKAPVAAVRWWSEVDRAQFRLDLDEMSVGASSKLDWSSNFRLTVIASGAREGNWEAFARRARCGGRHRLPRRGFALIETSVQPLLDGKWKIWVRAYESR